jgi:gliding motility-associated-like protein
VDSATVTVNVLPYITVSILADTAICATDSITLRPVSYALSYLWTQSGATKSLSSYTVKYPLAAPAVTTTYYVTANLGHCQDSAKETVYVSPYPSATVGGDTTLCFGKSARLHAATTAAYYTWSPVSTLYQYNTLTPLAGPQQTTSYLFTVTDTGYCPKSVTDTVTVIVIPTVTVSAGNDTTVVINQPLQLTATSNNSTVSYAWSPAEYLGNPYIYNPVATITSANPDSVVYMVTATTPAGCYGVGYVTVKIFETAPDIFVPGAFTPNGDGTNDVIRPILAGIAKFYYFRIFNRWGQPVFETAQQGAGWDGRLKGEIQPQGTYVFMTEGKDYLGKTIFKKGTIVLVR